MHSHLLIGTYIPCRTQHLEEWIDRSWKWLVSIGLREDLLHRSVHSRDKLAHYARACTDLTFTFPFGTQELMGIAARGDYDLTQHAKHSGKNLDYLDPVTGAKYIPHVIEPSIGVDRLFLALLCSAYREEVVDGEKRVVLGLHPSIAPVKAAVFPLVGNKPEITGKAREVFRQLQMRYSVEFDSAGAIGRRYRRADEAGTPFCVTVDFDSLQDECVTVRERDSMQQARMRIEELLPYLARYIDAC
jgi:glycyl-tRNA synthetase